MEEKILELIEAKQYTKLKEEVAEMNPADLGVIFEEVPEKDLAVIFRILPKELAAEVFAQTVCCFKTFLLSIKDKPCL